MINTVFKTLYWVPHTFERIKTAPLIREQSRVPVKRMVYSSVPMLKPISCATM